jgi:RNA polymerase sigma factor (sigma-70 family)
VAVQQLTLGETVPGNGTESFAMEPVSALIYRATAARTAQSDKRRAFDEIVRRFQDLAFGCAYAVLGDFQRAEDAAQEAFIVAWRNLDQLRQPEAFPGWFKRIVLTQCNRQTRNKQLDIVSFETVHNLPSLQPEPHVAAERSEVRERVLAAINSLPANERMVTTLFYINEYSQNEIAAFLELPLSTIKKRLYCARQQLRHKMLDIVRDTLRQQRPSRDRQFANIVALYNEALDSFLDKIRQDRYVIAVILYGSLAYDQVWEKSDIDLMLVGRDEKLPIRSFSLLENGINIHATLVPRSKFKQSLEGQLQSSFTHSAFSKSALLYTTDETIRDYYQGADRMGARDIQLQLLRHGQEALTTLAKAEKWYHVKRDLTYSFLWIMYTVNSLAHIEVIQQGEVTTREVLHQALRHNPTFFNAVYFDLVHQKKDEAAIRQALERIDHYLDSQLMTLFRPVLEYLEEQGGIRSTTDLDAYFKKQVQTGGLSIVYEWLADKGVIQKVPSPRRLHEKSRVEMEEAAYYYDGRLDDGGLSR